MTTEPLTLTADTTDAAIAAADRVELTNALTACGRLSSPTQAAHYALYYLQRLARQIRDAKQPRETTPVENAAEAMETIATALPGIDLTLDQYRTTLRRIITEADAAYIAAMKQDDRDTAEAAHQRAGQALDLYERITTIGQD